MERKAKEYNLDNIKSAFGARTGLLSRIASFEEDSGLPLTLANFVDYYHLDPRIIYRHHSFYRLCANAGVKKDFSEPMEEVVTRAFSRICAIDSRRWISFLLEKLPVLETVTLSDDEEAMLRMLQFTIWQKSFNECGFQT